MEDLLILILQALSQFIFEFFAWWPWDWIFYRSLKDDDEITFPWKFWAILLTLAVGAAAGWCSLHFFPDVLVRWGWLRIALLFLSPLGSGLLALQMARWRQKRDEFVQPAFHFWIALCFSVGLVWVRFAFGIRPH